MYGTLDPEKQPLRPAHECSTAPRARVGSKSGAARRATAVVVLALLGLLTWHNSSIILNKVKPFPAPGCAQFEPLRPAANAALDANQATVFSAEYRNKSASVLSGFVRVPSQSFDDLGPIGEDSRWEAFYEVPKYLEATFPLVHATVTREMVNTHGLVYTWQGSDTSLKPIVLMGHQDTVPVNMATLDQWEYPPWDGVYDGTFVHGRGSIDCKNSMTAILESWELLIAGGFKPRRTILFTSGFDEESGGVRGAGAIAEVLEGRYGKGGIEFVWDEGGMGLDSSIYGDKTFVMPALGEKGFANVNFTLHTPGGHSSIPPPHTGIGMLASFVKALEDHPFAPTLGLDNPTFSLLTCAAEHGTLDKKLKKDILAGQGKSSFAAKARDRAAATFAKFGIPQRYLVATSQAVDIISSGVKVNALPELGFVTVNYRVSVDSSIAELEDSIKSHILPLAKGFGLEVDAFGEKVDYTPSHAAVSPGKLMIENTGSNQVAPVSPSSPSSSAWTVFAGSIRHAYGDRTGEEIVVAPSLMTGGTDTKFYWDLSENIYRFTPMDKSKSFGQHTVGEKMLLDDHLQAVWLFHEAIRNADAATF